MFRTTLLVSCLVLSACSAAPEDDDGAAPNEAAAQVASSLTYYRDIKPIIDERCTPCHTAGGGGHFSLTSFDQVQPLLPVIRNAVESGRMPPWRATGPLDHYQDDRRLSPTQKKALLDWIDTGAPVGDPAETRKPQAPVHRTISRVDLTLPIETYTPGRGDDYRCFVLDWPVSGRKYITGLNIEPGDKELVHHAIVYLVAPESVASVVNRDAADPRPGYSCPGGGPGNSDWLQSYEPGGYGQDNPGGVGFEMQPGARLVLQVHYNTLQKQGSDRSRVDLMLADRVDRVGEVELLMNPTWPVRNMRIPANEPDVEHAWEGRPGGLPRGQSFDLYWADLHAHTRATSMKMGIVRARNGARESLLDIPNWSFEWQETYLFRQPVRLGPDDEFYVECHFDNSADNQPIIDGERLPVRDVNWGEGTTDEMCLGNVLAARATTTAVPPAGPLPPRAEPLNPRTPTPDGPKPDQPKPDQPKPDQPKPDQPKPDQPPAVPEADWPWVDDPGFKPPTGFEGERDPWR